MNWRSLTYDDAVFELREQFHFDFTSIGLALQPGSALRWLHTSGTSGERYKRIVLSPGHGIGGIVLKTGKPMRFANIDTQLDPQAYSSFPIVFAEDLHSFIALPLVKDYRVIGVVLCAFRSSSPDNELAFENCLLQIKDGLCDFEVVTDGFLKFNEFSETSLDRIQDAPETSILSLVEAREEERRAISRELHDGLAQELLSVSMIIKQIALIHDDDITTSLVTQAEGNIDRLLDETRNLSVQLRPLALDDLGLTAALRAQASVYSKMFGPKISVDDSTSHRRYPRDIETQAYRIAQEALLNACKYSNSDVIDVILTDTETSLTVAVCDQGTGFDTKNPLVKGHGCGMGSMQERSLIIGANLNVFSTSDGTTVTLTAPLP